MIKIARTRLTRRRKTKGHSTGLAFSANDLTSLARVVAAGQVLLQMRTPVSTRLKAALTRMVLPTPQGL